MLILILIMVSCELTISESVEDTKLIVVLVKRLSNSATKRPKAVTLTIKCSSNRLCCFVLYFVGFNQQ